MFQEKWSASATLSGHFGEVEVCILLIIFCHYYHLRTVTCKNPTVQMLFKIYNDRRECLTSIEVSNVNQREMFEINLSKTFFSLFSKIIIMFTGTKCFSYNRLKIYCFVCLGF